jgi:ArsR family transcriptional regulator
MRNRQIQPQELDRLAVLKALASPSRLQVMEWLKSPVESFPPQVDGDLRADGACADFIREKLGVAAATASRHLAVLTEAGLLVATRKRGWTFYRRDEAAIARFAKAFARDI